MKPENLVIGKQYKDTRDISSHVLTLKEIRGNFFEFIDEKKGITCIYNVLHIKYLDEIYFGESQEEAAEKKICFWDGFFFEALKTRAGIVFRNLEANHACRILHKGKAHDLSGNSCTKHIIRINRTAKTVTNFQHEFFYTELQDDEHNLTILNLDGGKTIYPHSNYFFYYED